jgi:flagellin-like hook-associated protein FlgL
VDPTDDAGGLAVATKLAATLNRNARTQQNVQNTVSFLQVQDGALAQATKILDRMSELKVMSLDPTKNSDDIANYDAEFTQLQSQLTNIKSESFNGINLFNATANLTVYTTEEGDASGEPSVTATRTGLFQALGNVTYGGSANGATGTFSVSEFNSQADYTAPPSSTDDPVYVKATQSDGSIRMAYVKNDITGTGAVDFQGAINAGDLIEITNVDTLYDYETGMARSTIFDPNTSEHEGGEVVFDDATNSFYLAAGDGFDYDVADTTGTGGTIDATAGEFIKLSKYTHLSDYSAFSSTDNYELGDIVSYDNKLYVANDASITAGGAVPDGNAAFTELSSYSVSGADLLTTSNSLANYSVGDFTTFIQNAATARAQNGAEAARMNSALEMLKSNQGNIDAARSRLADVDVALESTNLAKQNILVQSAAAMLSQANASQNVALQLLS